MPQGQRSQTTARTAEMTAAQEEVHRASEAWVEAFNRGDFEACSLGYTENASMQGRPLANVQGREAIADFWQGVLAQDPGQLVYEDSQVHALDSRIAVLSARWSMSNLGHGIITLERWEKQTDGQWLLVEDIFEISDQKSPD